MNSLLKYVNDKYYVKLGEYSFSPIMEATSGLALEYCKVIHEDSKINEPIIFCFPEKKSAAVWLSASLLINFFLEDYVSSNNIVNVNLQRGDLIEVYGSVARFLRYDKTSSKLVLTFKEGGEFFFNQSIVNSIKKTTKTSLNNHKHFGKSRKKIKSKRNAISKILIPKESDIINDQVLCRKCYLLQDVVTLMQ